MRPAPSSNTQERAEDTEWFENKRQRRGPRNGNGNGDGDGTGSSLAGRGKASVWGWRALF
jgi:hypothetical protein